MRSGIAAAAAASQMHWSGMCSCANETVDSAAARGCFPWLGCSGGRLRQKKKKEKKCHSTYSTLNALWCSNNCRFMPYRQMLSGCVLHQIRPDDTKIRFYYFTVDITGSVKYRFRRWRRWKCKMNDRGLLLTAGVYSRCLSSRDASKYPADCSSLGHVDIWEGGKRHRSFFILSPIHSFTQ